MSVDGEIREAFSGKTLTVPKTKESYISEIVENSRKLYSNPRANVEKMLSKWDEAGEFENTGPEEAPEFEEPLI
jgi:hypothetical protein